MTYELLKNTSYSHDEISEQRDIFLITWRLKFCSSFLFLFIYITFKTVIITKTLAWDRMSCLTEIKARTLNNKTTLVKNIESFIRQDNGDNAFQSHAMIE